jgi:hypothetical protein
MTDRLLIAHFENVAGQLRAKTAALWIAVMRAFQEAGAPQTVRQVFYKVTTFGHVPKTEAGYKQIAYHLLTMRRAGVLPYWWIADNTRWTRKPKSYDDISQFLTISRDAYRRSLWAGQSDYVEIWCEKDALAGVLYEVTADFDVPLMVTRGFSSETFVYEAAQTIKRQGKPAYIYYFGDYDPSGIAARDDVRRKLELHGARVHFAAVAVLPWQVSHWNLPTRPTKKTDSRAKDWRGDSVELDAIPADTLRRLVADVIERHINDRQLAETLRAEELERESLEAVIANLGLVPNWTAGHGGRGNGANAAATPAGTAACTVEDDAEDDPPAALWPDHPWESDDVRAGSD